MTQLLLTSVRRYPDSNQQPLELLIDSGRVEGWYSPGKAPRANVDEVIDLEGRWIAPTFVDSHLHLLYTEQHSKQVDLACLSVDEIDEKLSAKQSDVALIGHGWRDPIPEKMLPNPRRFLDQRFPEIPVLLWNADFHRVLVNSKLLDLLNKDSGHPGVLVEEEAEEAWNLVKSDPSDEVAGACHRLLGFGISAATTFDRGESIKAFLKSTPGDHGVIVRHGLAEEEFLESLEGGDIPPVGGLEDDFAVRWVKIFVDGTLGSRTAWMKKDFSDDPGNRGVCRRSGESLFHTAREAALRGWGLALHAIGDAAVHEAIHAIRVAQSVRPSHIKMSDRIEHLQLLDPEDIPLLIESGAYASLQPCHLFEDRQIIRSRWGDRADFAIPFRQLMSEGVPVITGTDAPIESLDPWADIYAAVHRKNRDGSGVAEGPRQRVTFEEAFLSKTAWAAVANQLPSGYGTLKPGSRADFQVLEKEPQLVANHAESGLVQVFTFGAWRLVGKGSLSL
ncbi:MAG: hypothetical protein CBC13_03250 [Planctomycetia bacterium TMED53]|nr:MAG: hypothetical protein CBC13_03250 [Planctomycetia bacterium TMED53]